MAGMTASEPRIQHLKPCTDEEWAQFVRQNMEHNRRVETERRKAAAEEERRYWQDVLGSAF